MPKENINCDGSDAIRVEVHWETDRFVDVATTIRRDEQQTSDAPEHFTWSGTHSTLDRAGINRLIRVLRRARDAAYGADA